MASWRFLVVRHFGSGQQRRLTCAHIKQQVQQRGLSKVLPLVKYELNRGGEYYLGVAIDINASMVGTSAEETGRRVLVDCGIGAAANPEFCWLLEAKEVQGFLRGTIECESFTIPIAYETDATMEAPPVDRLLSEVDFRDLQAAEPNELETERYSRLLQWCSAIGSGGIDRIKQACQALGIATEWGGAWSVLRRFVLLGHLEFDGGASFRWSVIPPTMVAPAESDFHGILVGQRTEAMFKPLSDNAQLEESPQPNGPPRLAVRDTTNELTYRPGYRVHDAGCVSRQLQELLPGLDDWMMRLPCWDERDFGRFVTEKYDPIADEFREVPTITGHFGVGLYRFALEQSARRTVTNAFFDDVGNRWVSGDYYGLRFLARARSGSCRCLYHTYAHQLFIPEADRWPMPYERVLVLASGLLPRRIQAKSGANLLLYDGIPSDLAAHMTELLDLEMEGMDV